MEERRCFISALQNYKVKKKGGGELWLPDHLVLSLFQMLWKGAVGTRPDY